MLLKTLDGRLDKAEKTLKSAGTAQRSLVLGLDGNTAGRFAMGVMGIEETAQAFTDYEQSVLNIVYSLSGMQTTNKEMERFLKAYMPRSGESNKRLKIKTTQLRAMLSALRSAKSRGLEGEAAQQFAVTEWTKHVPGKRPTGLTGQPRQEVQDEFMRRLRELGNR